MKKSILAIAVAATMAAPAAMAAPTVYGNIHLSINAADNDIPAADNGIKMSSNTSSLGVKGSEDLGDGLKAIYKAEWEIDIAPNPTVDPDGSIIPNSGGSGNLTGRDQFLGLKGGFGTIALGTMSSNYKQMGGKVDPLYRTPLEGRGFLDIQSNDLHGGKGVNRGRQTDTVQYTSPKMGGISLVANYTLSGAGTAAGNTNGNNETTGIGLRWSSKAFMLYADWIDATPVTASPSYTGNGTESAVKVGGKFSAKAFDLALQYEAAQDLTSRDYVFLAGTWNINKNNGIILTYGMTDVDEAAGDPSEDTTGVAVAYNHKMSKMTNVYVGYGAKSSDVNLEDASMLTAGMRVKF